jgi:hypothetical protein
MNKAITRAFTARIVSRQLKGQSPSPAKTPPNTKTSHLDRYSTKVVQLELARVKKAWIQYQPTRDRDGVYIYLQAVFDLFSKWKEQRDTIAEFHRAFGSANHNTQIPAEPFSALIFCTSDREKVDDRTRCKWSRALRYAASSRRRAEPLKKFIKRLGGINECASRFGARRKRSGS